MTHPNDHAETTLRPEKRPIGSVGGGFLEAKEATSKSMNHGDGRAVIVVHEHNSHGSAVALQANDTRTAVRVKEALLKVAARPPQPVHP